MIKFSDKQLKIPKLMRPVYLVTAGQSKFDRAFPDKRTEELCVDALVQAAELLNLSPAELKSTSIPATMDTLPTISAISSSERLSSMIGWDSIHWATAE